jgi:phospholipid/cholesterol/gamma-HCH transport system substrate-binding protein
LEIRASYLLVGSVVLVLLAALAGFTVWIVRADLDRAFVLYEIAFEGSVTGLQEGGEVRYRGVPVGRVSDISIDPDNVEQVLITVELEPGTPVKQDTLATLELQGITGIAYVQLRGGTQESAPIAPRPPPDLARIPSRPSTLERVFEATPELLARSVVLLDRIGEVLTDDNVEALGRTVQSIDAFTAALAAQSDDIAVLISSAAGAAGRVEEVSGEVLALTTDLRRLSATLDASVGEVGGDLTLTLNELRSAAEQLDAVLGGLRQPLDDFAGSGLYDFSQLVGETRLLIAALNRITTEFERDPTGFFIGGQRGFQAE